MNTEPQFNINISQEGDVTTVILNGVMDENFDMRGVFEGIDTPKVIVNLKGVSRINSMGVRKWINITRNLGETLDVTFVECSTAVVIQLNMIMNFLSSGKIESFHAPYFCDTCDKQHEQLIVIDKAFPNPEDMEDPEAPEFNCPQCNKPMDFDEYEEKYFAFLMK